MEKSDTEIYSIIEGFVSRRKQGLGLGFNPTFTRSDRMLIALRLRELAAMVENSERCAVQLGLGKFFSPVGWCTLGSDEPPKNAPDGQCSVPFWRWPILAN